MMAEYSTDTPSLHQLIRAKLLAIVVVVCLLICSIVSFTYNEQTRLQYQLNVVQPQSVIEAQRAQAKYHITQTIAQINQLASAERLVEYQQVLDQRLVELNQLISTKLSVAFDKEQIGRISSTAARNEELRTLALKQVEQLLYLLNDKTLQLDQIQQTLAQQLASDSSSSVNATEQLKLMSRYIELIKGHGQLIQVQQHLQTLSILLNALNLQTELSDFELIANKIKQTFDSAEQISSAFYRQQDINDIREKIDELNTLLVVEQRLEGKWRGYLRLYADYRQLLNAVTSEIETISDERVGNTTGDFVNGQVIALLASFGLVITLKVFNYLVFSLVLIFATLLVTFIVALIRQVRQWQRETLIGVTQVLEGNEPVNIDYWEQTELYSLINKVQKPQHSDQDYKLLQQTLNTELDNIAQLAQVCTWQFNQGQLQVSNQQRLQNALEQALTENLTWSRVKAQLSKSGSKALIKLCKAAKLDNDIHRADVLCANNQLLTISVVYQEQGFTGTVSNAQAKAQVINELSEQQQQLKHRNNQALLIAEHNHQALGNMVVQAMLQSQNSAVISGVANQPIYRQLSRIFDWLRQQQIAARLRANEVIRQHHDVQLIDEINAVALNAVSEAQLSHNQVLLHIDPNIITAAKIDIRLFNRLLSTLCRLLLKDQFKSELLLSFTAIDQNAGQQHIKISAQLNVVKPLAQLPLHIASLLEDGDNLLTSTESYFKTLLAVQHGEHLNAELTEQGFVVSFELPIAAANQITATSSIQLLTKKSVLLLSASKPLKRIISSYIDHAKGRFESLSEFELFQSQYGISELSNNKLDCLLLAADQIDHLQAVEQHLSKLPKTKQPRLMVLQSPLATNYQRHGFYSQVITPLCRAQFIAEIASMIKNKTSDNLWLPAELFEQERYLPTQVEVLLAVSCPGEHLSLWRLLHWLGFQVKVVSQPTTMVKHWQSGRYLVLMNEFEQSPFIELATGKSIARGVFSFVAEEVIELNEEQAEYGKHWHFGVIPELSNVKRLISLLNPWLKKEQHTSAEQTIVAPVTQALATPKKSQPANQHSSAREDRLFGSSLIDDLPPAFDLEQFAENQGSPELAVYMLDDYLAQLTSQLDDFENALTQTNTTLMQVALSEIIVLSSILAAKGLRQIASQLEQALLNHAYENMQRFVQQAKAELAAIRIYADAI